MDTAFGLVERVGPLYDILRHPKTQTPLTAAIYGSWGSGKTTAMHWLDGLLGEWQDSDEYNKNRKSAGYDTIRTVWFYPWKYQTREDVWRGLIAEVIVETIKANGADLATVKDAVSRFGKFLGRSFLNVLDGIEIEAKGGVNAGIKGEAGGKVSLESVRKIVDDFKDTNHPEKEFLNEFEESFTQWVKATIGKRTRLVIFIDDLDRCMPTVAMQVLEALKLYLKIEGLIFVVGIDRAVVDTRIVKMHEDEGVPKEYASQYLAKMFQVEVALAPAEESIQTYLNKLVSTNPHWRMMAEAHQQVFRTFILSFGKRNPRQVKRLINGATMAGLGTLRKFQLGSDKNDHLSGDTAAIEARQKLCIAQGVQEFCIRQVLELREGEDHKHIGRNIFDRFLQEWTVVRQSGAEGCTTLVTVPAGWYRKQGIRWLPSGVPQSFSVSTNPDFAPDSLWTLLVQPYFAEFWPLLADADLAALLDVPYPGAEPKVLTDERKRTPLGEDAIKQVRDSAVGKDAQVKDTSAAKASAAEEARRAILRAETKDTEIIRDAIALQLKVRPEELTVELLKDLTNLNLNGTGITDAAPLAGLTALKYLDLNGTGITDAAPLAGLTSLTDLDLNGTGITDAAPLAGLTALTYLFLKGTGITDAAPLAGLTSLTYLDLNGTGITDAAPLAGLTSLIYLDLDGTGITDATPLAGMTALTYLFLKGTGITDAAPLAALKKLRRVQLPAACRDTWTPPKPAIVTYG